MAKERSVAPRAAYERSLEDLVGRHYGEDLVVVALDHTTTKYPQRRVWRCRHERCGCEVFRSTAQLGDSLVGGCRRHGGNHGNVEHLGRSQSLREWCDELGINYGTAISRFVDGKPTAEVLRVGRPARKLVELDGERMSQADAARRLGITRQALSQQLRRAAAREASK